MNIRKIYQAALLILLSALLIVGITVTGMISFMWVTSHEKQSWNVSLEQISSALKKTEQGYRLTESSLLDENELWAILIDEQGQVVWEWEKPQEIPERYDITDIASFSRWYLKDYPVHVRIREDGLLVLGFPKNSIWKYGVEFDMNVIRLIPYWAGGIFLLSLICVVVILRKVLKKWFSKEQQVRDKARSNWINGISHDIRTPLSMVMGYASQLEEDSSLTREQRNKAAVIRCQSQTIKSLVGDLNLTMRLDYEMQPLRKMMLYPAALVRQTAADFLNSGLDERYELELAVSEQAQDICLYADEALLRRALDNLVNNCVRHNPDGCSIVMGVKRERNQCVLSVQNSTDKAFQPTEQNQETQSDGMASHGTGLRLVQQIAQAHGGTTKLCIKEGIFLCELSFPIAEDGER